MTCILPMLTNANEYHHYYYTKYVTVTSGSTCKTFIDPSTRNGLGFMPYYLPSKISAQPLW